MRNDEAHTAPENGDLDELLSHYLDELNADGFVDPEEILSTHPEHGPAILRDLESYIELRDCESEHIRSLGDYTLRRQIGRGGVGVVYEAWEGSMDRVVALKVLPAAVAADNKAFVRFMREAKTAGQLKHPSIVHVHGLGLQEDIPYYAMEFVEGETLGQVLARMKSAPDSTNPFGERDQLEFFGCLAKKFADVADGLQHAHSRGVVHRDIKPSNLIFDGDGRLRILDFGLAAVEGQDGLTLSSDFVGTPLYMSPEQAKRRRIQVDHRSDIYSLGVTLYEVVTGRPPHRGKSHADTMSQILEHDPPVPRSSNARIPRDLQTIILKCLRKDPVHRYRTAEALGQDLRRFARGDDIEARDEGRSTRLFRRMRRHRGRVALAVCAALLTLVSGTLVLREIRERAREIAVQYDAAMLDIIARSQSDRLTIATANGNAPDVDPRGLVDFFNLSELEETRFGSSAEESLSQLVDRLTRLIAIRPRHPDAYCQRARIRFVLDDVEAAAADLEKAEKVSPNAIFPRVLKHEFGLVSNGTMDPRVREWKSTHNAIHAREWTTADAHLDRLLTRIRQDGELWSGEHLEARLTRGLVRLRMDAFHAAIEDLVSLREIWPCLVEPHVFLARAYMEMERPNDADRVLREFIESSGDQRTAQSWVIMFWATEEEFERGLALAKKTDSPLASWFLHRLGRNLEAIDLDKKRVARKPSDPHAHFLIGTHSIYAAIDEGATSIGRQHYNTATRELAESCRLEGTGGKSNDLARAGQGRLALMRGDLHAAKVAFDLQATPTAHHWANVGHHYALEHRPAEALAAYQHAIRRRPRQAVWLRAMAWNLRTLGRPAESFARLAEVQAIAPNAPSTHRSLGFAYRDAKSHARAAHHFFFAHSLGNRSAARELSVEIDRIDWTDSTPALTQLEEELEIAETKLTASEVSVEALDAFARWRLRSSTSRDLEIAKKLTRKSIRQSGERHPRSLETLARIQLDHGDAHSAESTLRKALMLPDADASTRTLACEISALDCEAVLPTTENDRVWLEHQLDSERIVRLDAGSTEDSLHCGERWSRDRFFQGGWANKRSFRDIRETSCPELYRSQRTFRSGSAHSGYRLPLANRRYEITLHFAETKYWHPGRRVFDILIEDQPVELAFDLTRGGVFQATEITRTVDVLDGALDLRLQPKSGDAQIAGIVIRPVD